MKISNIEPIRFTPFVRVNPRSVAGTTYVPSALMRRDDSTRIGPMAEYPLIVPEQTHGTRIGWVTEETMRRYSPAMGLNETRRLFPDTDALLTSLRGIALGVRTADCLPLLFYARDIQVAGAVHAGWKGTLNGIARSVALAILKEGASPENIMVRFGPAICGACYEVDPSLAQKFADAGMAESVTAAPKADPLTDEPFPLQRPHINLVKANRIQLASVGIPAANFFQSDLCTRHTSLSFAGSKGSTTHFPYYSYRRMKGTPRRNTSFVLLLPE